MMESKQIAEENKYKSFNSLIDWSCMTHLLWSLLEYILNTYADIMDVKYGHWKTYQATVV